MLFGALGLGALPLAGAAESAPSPLAAIQKATTPQQAFDRLVTGNARFATGASTQRDYQAEVQATANGQFPLASIVACLDSRTSPELLFDLGLGESFAARIAGNFVNEDILGSLEFAHKVAGAKVIVVVGHTSCGAVKGACDNVEVGNLTAALAKIRPAVLAVKDDGTLRSSKNSEFVAKVAAANVRHAVQQIRDRSPLLAAMLDSGEIGLIGGMYDLHSGKVTYYPDTAVNLTAPAGS